MARSLTDEDIDAIAHRLASFSGLTPEQHRDHHNAFAAYIAAQQRKAEFREKIAQQLGGWMVLSVLTGIGYAAWHGFLWVLQKGN